MGPRRGTGCVSFSKTQIPAVCHWDMPTATLAPCPGAAQRGTLKAPRIIAPTTGLWSIIVLVSGCCMLAGHDRYAHITVGIGWDRSVRPVFPLLPVLVRL